MTLQKVAYVQFIPLVHVLEFHFFIVYNHVGLVSSFYDTICVSIIMISHSFYIHSIWTFACFQYHLSP